MNKKYEFTGETCRHGKLTLRQIRYLSDGGLGGWIEDESNLSHDGDCRVFGYAKVWGNAKVIDNAKLYGRSWVYDSSVISGNATLGLINGRLAWMLKQRRIGDGSKGVLEYIRQDPVAGAPFRGLELQVQNSTVSGNADLLGEITISRSRVTGNTAFGLMDRSGLEISDVVMESSPFDDASVKLRFDFDNCTPDKIMILLSKLDKDPDMDINEGLLEQVGKAGSFLKKWNGAKAAWWFLDYRQ